MKKAISFLVIMLLVVGMNTAALAHGCGRGGNASREAREARAARKTRYAVCTVEGCDSLGLHKHDGIYYHCASYGTGQGCERGVDR